ncbi:MAG: protein BatD, partial [Ignavibacteriae bacterium]|nr:protein BatD [Ignavibacteriota bacterium]
MNGFITYQLIAILAMFVLSGTLNAQDISFEASVDRNTVALGEQFTLRLVLTNAGMSGGKNLKLPDLNNFHIMGGPNQSTSMQFINGVVTSSVSYTYTLQSKDVGKFAIGPASIEAGGKVYATNPVTIEVVKGSSRPQQQPPTAKSDVGANIGDNLFLRATVDKSHVIQGEQINLTFKLYTRVSVSNYTVSKNPAFTGFWGEDVETPKNVALSNETVDGRQYRVGIIKRVALFPTQSGTLEISPMEVQTTVQIQDARPSDPFDAFFRDPFGRNVNYAVKSNAIKIKVDPLPAGAPLGFRGAVGRFTMSTTVDKKTGKTNEPISLKVSLSGVGNIKLLESPQVELPADFEQY